MLQSLAQLSQEVASLFEGDHKPTSIQSLKPIIQQYSGTDWKAFVNFKDDCYARNYIYRNEDFEILVICWQPGQGSPIHNHADRGCVLRVLEGELQEIRYYTDEREEKTILGINRSTYIDNSIGLHKIVNQSDENTVSLHIYSPGFFIPKTGDCMEDFDIISLETKEF